MHSAIRAVDHCSATIAGRKAEVGSVLVPKPPCSKLESLISIPDVTSRQALSEGVKLPHSTTVTWTTMNSAIVSVNHCRISILMCNGEVCLVWSANSPIANLYCILSKDYAPRRKSSAPSGQLCQPTAMSRSIVYCSILAENHSCVVSTTMLVGDGEVCAVCITDSPTTQLNKTIPNQDLRRG